MKRIALLMALAALASLAYAQTVPGGAAIRISDGTWYLNKTNYTWGGRVNYPDTLAIGAGKWTAGFKCPNGYLRQEGVAILTAGTDSFKIILYGSNSQPPEVTLDSTMLTPLDSTRVLAAGLYVKVWNVSGKWAPWLVLKFIPLNPGATITGKSHRNSLGLQ